MKFSFDLIYDCASQFWPAKMISVESKAMLIAIGLQESRFEHRRQVSGPARGFWQFEQGGGIHGVLNHAATRRLIRDALDQLRYDDSTWTCYTAVEHNDVLAMTFARYLLWTVAGPLPVWGQHQHAWRYYVDGWRPGKPHRETWDAFYNQAWEHVLNHKGVANNEPA